MTERSGPSAAPERRAFLRDGRSVLLRPVRASDEQLMFDFSRRLSRQTLAQRLLGPVPRFQRDLLRQFVEVDGVNHLALVAILDDAMIATARLLRIEGSDHADVTFTVEDAFQGQGLGPVLLDHLAVAGRRIGISVFEADVLTSNSMMLSVFTRSGYDVSLLPEGHLQHVVARIDRQAGPPSRFARRQQQAVRRSLEPLMRPRSVAVIGANRREGTIGHQIVRNLIDHGFTGPVYPVNPNAGHVAGLRAYAGVREAPRPVELAVVAVRAAAVADAVADCAAAGVGAIVVITADHDDDAGRVLAAPQLLSFVRSHGIRLVGPTSMGVLSVGPDSTLDVTFASLHPRPGAVAMSSQSGPLGLALLEIANRTGMGFSAFVSIGDAIDVSGIDLLEWWEDDPGTAAVLLQADRFGNPRDFVRIARRVSARKPIVAVASGDAATAALLGQAGIIHTANFDEMFDTALVLAHQPVPRGNRIAIVTNARDTGLLASRACAGNGLRPARVAGTPPQSPDPIIDLGPAATPQDYQRTLRLALGDPAVDAVLAIFIPPLVRDALDVGAAILGAARESRDTTMVASFMSESGVPEPLRAADVAVPSFTFPERAIAALGRAAAYGAWRRAAAGVVSYPSDMRRPDARRLVTAAGEGPLSDAEVAALFDCYGIPVAAEGPADADNSAAPAAPAAPASPAPAAPELDAVLGMRLDPLVGPVLRFALAGLPRDVFGDIALAVTPLTDRDAHRLVTSLHALPMLTGAAGGPAYDIGAVEDVLLRLSALVDDHERVTKVDIPRLRIGLEGRGAVAAAPAVRLGPSPVATPDLQ